MLNLFQHLSCNVIRIAADLSRGILKQVQYDKVVITLRALASAGISIAMAAVLARYLYLAGSVNTFRAFTCASLNIFHLASG
jgi:hypothetical protein